MRQTARGSEIDRHRQRVMRQTDRVRVSETDRERETEAVRHTESDRDRE